MTIGIYSNTKRDVGGVYSDRFAELLKQKKIESVKFEDYGGFNANVTGIDILVVFGGDGTMLSAVRQCSAAGVPVLGINIGHLGFLTECSADDMELAIESIISSDYRIEERSMIQAEYDGIVRYAVNEVSVSRYGCQHTILIGLSIDSKRADVVRGDGMLVCTPTGSTAYSLSCGGPILSPSLEAMAITAMSPHSLHSRPIVVDNNSIITLETYNEEGEVKLTVDGDVIALKEGANKVTISKADRKMKFIRLHDENFYKRLLSKLYSWDKENMEE